MANLQLQRPAEKRAFGGTSQSRMYPSASTVTAVSLPCVICAAINRPNGNMGHPERRVVYDTSSLAEIQGDYQQKALGPEQ
ncbi:hypothetical protein OPT61_g7692 [Boeremia exigua]|uniref:Uncharacterized protein n=1 Tax=Boeremia exigua TaxID=749465 RepID=A0ACC2I1V6_9PLEO|nr:hypothetical protein OPT61_g7692 [Boeremia exigua]